MKLEIKKLKMEIEHKKKVKQLKKKVKTYKFLNELKDKLVKEILKGSINELNNDCNEIQSNINNKKEVEKNKIDEEIKKKGGDLLSTLSNQFNNELKPIKDQFEKMVKQIK